MADTRQVSRPLSPHLQIYRLTITMVLSIVHRITGAALYLGTVLLAWWLIAVASGPEAYAYFSIAASSWLGQLVLIGYAWALIHHLLSGVRYLVWDRARAMQPHTADVMSWLTLVIALVLTAAIVALAYYLKGVL